MGRHRSLAALAVGLAAAPAAMAQVCTVNEWNAANRDTRTVDGKQYCIEYAATPLLPENALWQYRCPYLDVGIEADIGATENQGDLLWSLDGSGSATHDGSVAEHGAAVGSPGGCAEVCRRQAFGGTVAVPGEASLADHRTYLAPNVVNPATGVSAPAWGWGVPAPCKAFLYEPGTRCALLKGYNNTALSPNPGAEYYPLVDYPSAAGVTTQGPGTCGCPTAAAFLDRCVVGCEAGAVCVSVGEEVLVKASLPDANDVMGVGACRGTSAGDSSAADVTTALVDSPADCLGLCTGPECNGVTIMAPTTSSAGVCATTALPACASAVADQATCAGAGACTFNAGADGAANTCTATVVAACAAATASAAVCQAAGACTFTSTDRYTCEVWNKVLVDAGSRRLQKILASELNPGVRKL